MGRVLATPSRICSSRSGDELSTAKSPHCAERRERRRVRAAQGTVEIGADRAGAMRARHDARQVRLVDVAAADRLQHLATPSQEYPRGSSR